MKKKLVLIFLAAVFLIFPLRSGAASAPEWRQEGFVISAFHGVPGAPNENYRRIVENTKNAGFTHFETTFTSRGGVLAALELAGEYGISVIVQDIDFFGGFQGVLTPENSDETIAEAADLYSGYPAFAGYYVWDEPFLEQLDAARACMDLLEKHDPGALAYTVALPSYNESYVWADGSYPEYIDKYIEILDPPVISSNYYVFSADIDRGTPLPESNLFADMGYLRKKALELDRPLWYYIQMLGGIGSETPHVITEGQLRVQAYIALAYGVKGIQYYNSLEGIMDVYGNPNELYAGAAALNSQILSLGKTLMGLESSLVYSTLPLKNDGQIGRIGDSKILDSAPENMFFGEFRGEKGVEYLLPVNCDYENGAAGQLVLREARDIYRVDGEGGKLVPVAKNSSVIDFEYAAGEGALYVLKTPFIILLPVLAAAAAIAAAGFGIFLPRRKRGPKGE